MPAGGIGCGLVYLSGDGRLWHWDIFNQNLYGVYEGRFQYKGQSLSSGDGAAYIDPPKPHSPFEIGFHLDFDGGPERGLTMDHESSGWQDVTFEGRYPVGKVSYSSPGLPLEVELEACTPFVPLETDDSSLPATVMRYRLKNKSNKRVVGRMTGRLGNPVLLHTGDVERARLRTDSFSGIAQGIQCSAVALPKPSSPRSTITVDDFQHPTYGAWKAEGDAFGPGPIKKKDCPKYQGEFGGPGEYMVNSHASSPGTDVGSRDDATGKLTSPPFAIDRKYLAFWIGGGNKPKEACLNVVVDGKVIASATGRDSERMRLASLDLRRWQGRQATIEILDHAKGGWGHINVGQITLVDVKPDEVALELEPDFGTMALAVLGDRDVQLPNPVSSAFGEAQVSEISKGFAVEPGQSVDVTFIVGWHFPNCRFGIADDKSGRHYKPWFKDAAAVVQHVTAKPNLLTQTALWAKTWYDDSTLPHYFLNRTMSSASTLATSTCNRLATGRFYANEGVGCCAGTCTHVWHYAQAVGRLFPALERDTRERVDLGVGFHPDTGVIGFRAEFDQDPAVDGHAGTILRILREHQTAPDGQFLKRNWPRIRKAIEFLMHVDVGEDGLLKGAQGNTLDAVWYGESSWLSSLYLAALLAGEKMATTVGDDEFAGHCRKIFTAGQKSIDTLYNGEYYFQAKDPAHRDAWGIYDGCHIDQVFGQGWAWQVGLPRVLPPRKTISALKALYKYNFVPNMGPWRDKYPHGRWYAIEGDAGLVQGTNPKNEKEPWGDGKTWQNIYFIEVWTGTEGQAAGHMIAEGLLTEGLTVIRALDDRHDGNRRNPYNEIECSDHYSRAMSNYGAFVSITGFEIDNPAGYMGFQPRLEAADHQFAWVGAEGWGSYHQQGSETRLEVRHGKLKLLSFKPGAHYFGSEALTVKVGDRTIEALPSESRGWLMLHFPQAVEIAEGEALVVTQAQGQFGKEEVGSGGRT